MSPWERFFASRNSRSRSPMSIGILVPLPLSLPLNVKVNAGPRSILGDLLAINQHFKFGHARPLHAAHRLGGFGNGILSGFGEALFGRTHNLDDFLGHDCLLSWNRSKIGRASCRERV